MRVLIATKSDWFLIHESAVIPGSFHFNDKSCNRYNQVYEIDLSRRPSRAFWSQCTQRTAKVANWLQTSCCWWLNSVNTVLTEGPPLAPCTGNIHLISAETVQISARKRAKEFRESHEGYIKGSMRNYRDDQKQVWDYSPRLIATTNSALPWDKQAFAT